MKSIVKRAIREEEGKIMIMVLILLVVGGLVLGPLLGLMGTGLSAGQVYEKKAAELYAADAGVEEAVWRVANNLTGDGGSFNLTANGKDVEYYIRGSGCGSKRRYIVTSTAYTDATSSTTIEADLYGFSFPDNAITSRVDVDLGNNSHVDGRIQYGRDLNDAPNADYDRENVLHEVYANWPSSDELYSHYYPRYIEGKYFEYCYDSSCVIDARYSPEIGPLYRVGDLTFKSTDNKEQRELKLTGTIYVTQNLVVGKTEQNFTLNLNGQTIFCEGDIHIGGKTSITGSGSIIAKGSVYFEPMLTSKDGYVLILALKGKVDFQPGADFAGFVMSADGTVDFKPKGTFYGSVAGDVNVDLDSKVTVKYLSDLEYLVDFPFREAANWRIRTWSIVYLQPMS